MNGLGTITIWIMAAGEILPNVSGINLALGDCA